MTEPTDETLPTPTPARPGDPPATPAAPGDPPVPPTLVPGPTPRPSSADLDRPATTDAGASAPPLRADPDRPADPGWREPPWIPAKRRDRRPSPVALLVGLGLIAIGVWLFVDTTLGIRLPTIAWRSLWPVALIVVGALVLIRSLDRRP